MNFSNIDWTRWSMPGYPLLRILAIIALAWILIVVLQRAVRSVRRRVERHIGEAEGRGRAATLGRVLRYLIATVVTAVATMLILGELGIALAPIMGAAGVLGLAVGFGAQSLVKDYFTGFFLVFEDQIRSGDMVTVAGISGTVEDLTLRHVRLRDYNGNIHFVPNNLITTVTNMSRHYANAVMDIGVAYRENIDEVMQVMRQVGRQMRDDHTLADLILEDLEIAGVERLDNSAVVFRCRFKVAPLQQWTVRRQFLRNLKEAFDAHGIEIPFPHVTVYAGADKRGQAPHLPLRLARGAGRASRPGGSGSES